MYDPETDPDIQRAKLAKAQTASENDTRLREGATADRAGDMRGLLASITDPEQLRSMAPRMAALGYGTADNAQGPAEMAQLIAGLMDGGGDLVDGAFTAGGGRPDQTGAARVRSDNLTAATSRANNSDDNSTRLTLGDLTASTSRANNADDNSTRLTMDGNENISVIGPDGPAVITRRKLLDNPGVYQPIRSEAEVKGGILENVELTRPEQLAAVGAETRAPNMQNVVFADGTSGTVDANLPLPSGAQLVSDISTTPVAGRDLNGRATFTTPSQIAAGNSSGVRPNAALSDVKGNALEERLASGAVPQDRVDNALGLTATPSGTPKNYSTPAGVNGITLDGLTDAITGQPLPAGAQLVLRSSTTETPASGLTKGDESKQVLAGLDDANFSSLVGEARRIAEQDPTIFGTTGNVRRAGQAVFEQINNLGLLTGVGGEKPADLTDAYSGAYAEMARNGVDMSLFDRYDPNLNDITKLSTLLTFSAASVLAGQEGRSVSDKDVKMFRTVAGDPENWFGSQQSFLSGLDMMERILGGRAANRQDIMGGSATQPTPSAPTAAPSGNGNDPLGLR